MKSKIALLTNFYSTLNAGDQALLTINVEQLNAALAPEQFSVVCGWPDEVYFRELGVIPVASPFNLIGIAAGAPAWKQIARMMQGIASLRLFRSGHQDRIQIGWKNLFDSYQRADMVASVSGTHFYSTGRFGWPFPVHIFMLRLALEFEKPLYIMPQSIGPLKRKWEADMIRANFSLARAVFLRDQYSLRLADSLRLNKQRLWYSPDPGFRFQAGDPQKALVVLTRYGYSDSQHAAGLTIIPWQGRWQQRDTIRRYYAALEELGKKMYQHFGVKTYLFNQVLGPTEYNDDRVAAKYFIGQMKSAPDWLVYVDEELSAAELKACYGHMGMMIATRMHSGIFALAMNVPVLFLGYISKTRGLMESLGLEDWVIDLDQMDSTFLWEKAEWMWRERGQLSVQLSEMMKPMAAKVLEASDTIRQGYETQSQ